LGTTKYNFDVSIPDLLYGMVELSAGYENYTKSGYVSSYGLDLTFPSLHLSKTVKSSDVHLLRGKIEEVLHSWDGKYRRHLASIRQE
jgi:hypothetical protein